MEIISTQATAIPVNTSSPKCTDNSDDDVQLDPPNQAIVIASVAAKQNLSPQGT